MADAGGDIGAGDDPARQGGGAGLSMVAPDARLRLTARRALFRRLADEVEFNRFSHLESFLFGMWSFKKTAFNYRLTIEKVIIDLVGRTNISNQNKDSKNKSKKQENTDNKKVK